MSRNISKIMLVYFCTRFHVYIHVYALLLQSRGLSLFEISTIESVVIGAVFLLEVPTGVLADRVGRRWAIVASTFCLMCGELMFLLVRSYPLYLLMSVFTGAGFAFASGATESLIYDSLPPENRDQAMKRVMGRYNAVGQVAFFLSPLLGALIVGDLAPERFNLAIALTIGILACGVLVGMTLREPPSPWKAERSDARAIFRAGWSELRGSPFLRRLVLLTVFTTTFTGTLITTLSAPSLTANGVPPEGIALTVSIGSLLAALAQSNVHRIEGLLGTARALTLLTLLPGVSYLALALAAGPLAPPLLILWMYATNDLKAPLFSAYQNAAIQSGSRATVLSLMSMVVNLFIAIAAPIYAGIATQSLPLAFALIGAVIVIAGLSLRVGRLIPQASAT